MIYLLHKYKLFLEEYQVMELFNFDIINKESFSLNHFQYNGSSNHMIGRENVIACTHQIERWRGRHNFCNVMISLWPTMDSYVNWRETGCYIFSY